MVDNSTATQSSSTSTTTSTTATTNTAASTTSITNNATTAAAVAAAAMATRSLELATKSEPLFISVPPRPQRILHSDAYVKYIEGLNVNQKYIGPWEKTLNASLETTPPPDPEKLASVETWLGNGVGNHGSTMKALWALRKYMMNDALSLYKRST